MDAEERAIDEFGWLAEALLDLGHLNKSRKRFCLLPSLVFNFFAAVEEAMEMIVRSNKAMRPDSRQP
jgi:hypothetical protein